MPITEAKKAAKKKLGVYVTLTSEQRTKLDEIGKNLGGWIGQLTKQNSPAKAGEK